MDPFFRLLCFLVDTWFPLSSLGTRDSTSMAENTTPPLKVLVLGGFSPFRLSDYTQFYIADDGGVPHSYSQLCVLDEVLRRLQREKNLNAPPKPCEVFNIICGTGMGG